MIAGLFGYFASAEITTVPRRAKVACGAFCWSGVCLLALAAESDMSTEIASNAQVESVAVELGTELQELLKHSAVTPRLATVAEALADACAQIAGVLRGGAETGGGTNAVGSSNAFGDSQLEIDLRADGVIVDALKRCRAVATVSSEENPSELAIGNDSDQELYSVAFDPLDGSSIVDVNWAVGTIVR